MCVGRCDSVMSHIWVGTDRYLLKGNDGQRRADNVRLVDGSTHTFKMRKHESLEDFETRVKGVALPSQVAKLPHPAAHRLRGNGRHGCDANLLPTS